MNDAPDNSPVWDIGRIEGFFRSDFPQMAPDAGLMLVEEVSRRHSRVRMKYHADNLRPGGTIQGPALMALADVAAYVVLMGAYGEKATGAVTTSLQTDFLRKPDKVDIVAQSDLVKAGRTLAVCHVRMECSETGAVLAITNCTYAIPRQD